MAKEKFTSWNSQMVIVNDSEIANSMYLVALAHDIPVQWVFEAILRVSRQEILDILEDVYNDVSLITQDDSNE